MKKSRFTEEQIALALRKAEGGTSVRDERVTSSLLLPIKWRIPRQKVMERRAGRLSCSASRPLLRR